MQQINIYQAKSKLSRLIDQALAGEEIIIAKAGKPVVKLIPIVRVEEPRKPGFWEGKVKIHKDFDKLPADIQAAFEGEDI